VLRRVDVPAASLLNGTQREPDPDAADYFLFPRRVELPAPGLLGVMLSTENGQSGTHVEGFSEGSGAKAAGLEEGDRIVRVGEHPITSYADIRIALVDGQPGQKLPVEVVRERLIGADETLSFEVELH
jgi:S1-C subfamily serine protease